MEPRRGIPRLSPDVRAALAAYGAKATWPAGFVIYQRATPADGVFVVLSGRNGVIAAGFKLPAPI